MPSARPSRPSGGSCRSHRPRLHPWVGDTPPCPGVTNPFPRPPGSDTIPIARRPAVQFKQFYPAGPRPGLQACSARGPPDKSLFGGEVQGGDQPFMKPVDQPKWKVVENVVAAIERSLNGVQGAKVIANASVQERVSAIARQVDVCVEIPTGPRVLLVGVEVRDKAAALDLPEVEQLIAKLKKLDIDYGCIVSRAGFSASAKEEANRNGIELRTIAEVENPDWWLASTMSLSLRQVELLHFQVNFRSEELPRVTPLLAGLTGADLQITLATGESDTLAAFIGAQGIPMVDWPELAHLKDQDTFTATIDFSDLTGATLRCQRGPIPLPHSVHALYRYHHRLEAVPLAAYEASQGVNAFTGVSSGLKKQITLVTELNPDGTRTLSFIADDPAPPPTRIDRRDHGTEQSRSPDSQDVRG